MDGPVSEHSDSDSGESWTLLENSPVHGEDAPDFESNVERNITVINEKDEDTDGISIISDSDHESSTPCEISFVKYHDEEDRPAEAHKPQYISVNPLTPNINDHHESIKGENEFLGDNNGKLKTYVHRRNKRLSTVLNIIVLGSVITAAGVAIGHMWGARNECMMHTTPSVNKILSNLYKLQEENAYLRNKLKEMTFVSNIHLQQRKFTSENHQPKQQRCRKVFEESLDNKNAEKPKCVDAGYMDKQLDQHLIEPDFEKDFFNDINKLKHVYQQNKSWLDEEIAKRMKYEEESIKKLKNSKHNIKASRKFIKNEKNMQQIPSDKQNELKEAWSDIVSINTADVVDKKISYADSLKTDLNAKKLIKRDISSYPTEKVQENRKRKPKKQFDSVSEISISEDELKKDDRYIKHRPRLEKKKHDRQKLHKKQKRKNKYEQWEMKGGYLKDYDDFSVTSSQENEYVLKNSDENFQSKDFERNHYINQFSESDEKDMETKQSTETVMDQPSKFEKKTGKEKANQNKGDKAEWYDKRAAIRNEARKKLELELFGESSSNTAGWYFRRMQKREQCRAKGDNSTYRKLSKRNMNFKMKH